MATAPFLGQGRDCPEVGRGLPNRENFAGLVHTHLLHSDPLQPQIAERNFEMLENVQTVFFLMTLSDVFMSMALMSTGVLIGMLLRRKFRGGYALLGSPKFLAIIGGSIAVLFSIGCVLKFFVLKPALQDGFEVTLNFNELSGMNALAVSYSLFLMAGFATFVYLSPYLYQNAKKLVNPNRQA